MEAEPVGAEARTGMRKEGFWKRLLQVTLPLLAGGAHFAFSDGLAAAQRSPPSSPAHGCRGGHGAFCLAGLS